MSTEKKKKSVLVLYINVKPSVVYTKEKSRAFLSFFSLFCFQGLFWFNEVKCSHSPVKCNRELSKRQKKWDFLFFKEQQQNTSENILSPRFPANIYWEPIMSQDYTRNCVYTWWSLFSWNIQPRRRDRQ